MKRQVIEFMTRASTEMTTHDEAAIADLAKTLPNGATVYIAHTPKAIFDDVVRVSIKVQQAGLRACPHLVARRLPSEAALREGLKQLGDAEVDQALLVAGDLGAPLGPYTNTLDVIGSDVLTGTCIRHLGVAGHPEGHPNVKDTELLWSAMRQKQVYGAGAGIKVHVATQFGFDPQGLFDWSEQFERNGVALPVHAGMAGPTSVMKLMRFAMQCGVGASLTSASKNMKSVTSIARRVTTPEEMVPALVALGAGSHASRIVQPHVFTFGGAFATAKWMRVVMDGKFRMRADGSIALD